MYNLLYMENYLIGNVLKEYRTRLKISQEDLCLDLCAVSTLSRIESGEDFFKHDGKKALENYEKALKFSIKDYELGKIPNARVLTKTELLILNNISRTQYFLDEKDAAIDLMEFLK